MEIFRLIKIKSYFTIHSQNFPPKCTTSGAPQCHHSKAYKKLNGNEYRKKSRAEMNYSQRWPNSAKVQQRGNFFTASQKTFETLTDDQPKHLQLFYVVNLPQATSNTAVYSTASSAPPFPQTPMIQLKFVMLYSIVDIYIYVYTRGITPGPARD